MKWDELESWQKDELVHEKVFGWVPKLCIGPSRGNIIRDEDPLNKVGTPRGLWHCSLCQYMGCGDESNYPHNEREDIPDYSTDMNAAWQIVESEKFGSVEVCKRWLRDANTTENKYTCYILSTGSSIMAFGKTAQEAICKAALKAYGVEID